MPVAGSEIMDAKHSFTSCILERKTTIASLSVPFDVTDASRQHTSVCIVGVTATTFF